MVVTNPTKNPITVSIEGNEYHLPANGTISGVKESHASYWKTMLHTFIEVTPEIVAEPKIVVKEVKEILKEVVAVKEVTKK